MRDAARISPELGAPVTTVWRAISRFLGWLVVVAVIGLALACFKPQLDRQAKLDAELARLQQEKQALQEQNRSVESRIERIKHDPAYLEVQARDTLDLAREGETIIRFEERK